MKKRERVPKYIADKYSTKIYFMVKKDETLMEEVRPRKKAKEVKKQRVKVTPLTTPNKISKERKPTKKRNPVKESTSTPDKKRKSNVDIDLESGKSIEVIPHLLVIELIDQINKDGILSNIQHYYVHMDDKEQIEIEESVLLYLDIYKKTLLEIEN